MIYPIATRSFSVLFPFDHTPATFGLRLLALVHPGLFWVGWHFKMHCSRLEGFDAYAMLIPCLIL
jgi:hypothetical protein